MYYTIAFNISIPMPAEAGKGVVSYEKCRRQYHLSGPHEVLLPALQHESQKDFFLSLFHFEIFSFAFLKGATNDVITACLARW